MDILTGWILQKKHIQVTFHPMSYIVIVHILWKNITWACSCQVLWDSMYCQREEHCCLLMLKCQGLLSCSPIYIQNTELLLFGLQILGFQHLGIIHKRLILFNHCDRFNLVDNRWVCFHVHRHAQIKMCDCVLLVGPLPS